MLSFSLVLFLSFAAFSFLISNLAAAISCYKCLILPSWCLACFCYTHNIKFHCMILSARLGLVLMQYMWTQHSQMWQTEAFLTYLWASSTFPWEGTRHQYKYSHCQNFYLPMLQSYLVQPQSTNRTLTLMHLLHCTVSTTHWHALYLYISNKEKRLTPNYLIYTQ